jgi:DNA polymerase-3 subunit delta
MYHKDLARELKRGFPEALYVLWGDTSEQVDEILKEIEKIVLGKAPVDFNLDVFHKFASAAEIVNQAKTLPLLSPRRLIVIKDFHEFKANQTKTLVPYFKNLSDTTCMVIVSLKEPKEEILKAAKVFPLALKERDIAGWAKDRAKGLGFTLTEEAVDYLIELIGPDAGLLCMELDKLALSGKKTVSEKEIEALIGAQREYTPFQLIDAIRRKNKELSFRILHALLDSKNTTPYGILGALVWNYSQLYALWENKGKQPPKMNIYTYKTLSSCLPHCSLNYFYKLFKALHEADIKIKTSQMGDIALDALIINLLQIQK